MDESTTREKVLKKIRKALIHKTRNPYPNLDYETSVYATSDEPNEITFVQQFTAVNGQFVFCENEEEFTSQLQALVAERGWKNCYCQEKKISEHLDKADFKYAADENGLKLAEVGITGCENLIARTGSILVSSRQLGGRKSAVFPAIHITLAYTSQLVYDIKDAIQSIKNNYGDSIPSMITLITGPSRSADIEKTLVMGAHGPKEVFVFLIDNAS